MKMERGLPRPRFDNMPHPYSASDTEIAVIHEGRVHECQAKLLCGLCGLPVPNNDSHVITSRNPSMPGKEHGAVDRLLLHHRCAVMTKRWCPHLRDPAEEATIRKTSHRWYREKWLKL